MYNQENQALPIPILAVIQTADLPQKSPPAPLLQRGALLFLFLGLIPPFAKGGLGGIRANLRKQLKEKTWKIKKRHDIYGFLQKHGRSN